MTCGLKSPLELVIADVSFKQVPANIVKYLSTALHSQSAVTAYFLSKNLPLFFVAKHGTFLAALRISCFWHSHSASKHGLLTYVGLMLGQRRRRWTNIEPTLSHRVYRADWVDSCRGFNVCDVGTHNYVFRVSFIGIHHS